MKKIYVVYGCGGNHYFEDKESAIKLLKMDKTRRFFQFFNKNKQKILNESKLESVELSQDESNTKETT